MKSSFLWDSDNLNSQFNVMNVMKSMASIPSLKLHIAQGACST